MLKWMRELLDKHRPAPLNSLPEIPLPIQSREGLFRIWGDPNPILPLLRMAKLNVERIDSTRHPTEKSAAITHYNQLLEMICMRTNAALFPLPLGPDYEIADEFMTPMYLDYKEFLKTFVRDTIEKHIYIKTSQFIALVKIIKPRTNLNEKTTALVLERYRGASESKITMVTSTIPGYFANWFQKGEKTLVICSVRDHVIRPLGTIGRMPIETIDGIEYLTSFVTPTYWPGFPVVFKNGKCWIPWDHVRNFLSRSDAKNK